MSECNSIVRAIYVGMLLVVMFGLIGFGYYYDQANSYAARTAAEMSRQN